ncbi:MAG: hypothetical protein LBB18_04630 [Puniceicoccales bacterium]|jgi:DNA polymerase-3 subunit delta'|nr:hypothetical protein [Puniceicoccales bacterium]
MNLGTGFSKIENQRGFSSLLNSAARCEVPNSNLIVCKDVEICRLAVEAVAKKILRTENLAACVDFWQICPSGAMGKISVDQIRDVCAKIYLSPKVCPRKVVAIYGAEHMHPAASNAFLKTLEEPPADTVIVLTTPKLHAILPTIAGRCSITRLSSTDDFVGRKDVETWLAGYSAWLATLLDRACEEKNAAIMQMYSMLAQLEKLTETMAAETAEAGGVDGESTAKKEIYGMFFFKIENTTAEFFRQNTEYVKFFPKIVTTLEAKANLAALNVNFMVCIEAFLIEFFLMIASIRS